MYPQVYIGDGHFLDKTEIAELEKKESFKVRGIELLKVVLKTEDIGNFSLAPKDGREELQNHQVEATYSMYAYFF